MSAIPSHLTPLAQSLLRLSAQAHSPSVQSGAAADDRAPSASPSAVDTLTLSSALSSAEATAQVGRQNQLAALTDPAAALTVTQAAVSFLGAQPATALQAQANLDPSIALSLA